MTAAGGSENVGRVGVGAPTQRKRGTVAAADIGRSVVRLRTPIPEPGPKGTDQSVETDETVMQMYC